MAGPTITPIPTRSIRIPVPLVERVQAEADRRGVTFTALVVEILDAATPARRRSRR